MRQGAPRCSFKLTQTKLFPFFRYRAVTTEGSNTRVEVNACASPSGCTGYRTHELQCARAYQHTVFFSLSLSCGSSPSFSVSTVTSAVACASSPRSMDQQGEILLTSSGLARPPVPQTDSEMLVTDLERAGRTLRLFPDCGRNSFILPLCCTIWIAFPTLFWTLFCVVVAVFPWPDSGPDLMLLLYFLTNAILGIVCMRFTLYAPFSHRPLPCWQPRWFCVARLGVPLMFVLCLWEVAMLPFIFFKRVVIVWSVLSVADPSSVGGAQRGQDPLGQS